MVAMIAVGPHVLEIDLVRTAALARGIDDFLVRRSARARSVDDAHVPDPEEDPR